MALEAEAAAAAAWAASRAVVAADSAGTSAAAAGKLAASTAAAGGGGVAAALLVDRRSIDTNSARLKPDLVVLLTPEQARSLGAKRYVAAFGELKVRSKLMTSDGQPKNLLALYDDRDPVVVALMGQLLTYMNALKVSLRDLRMTTVYVICCCKNAND